MRHTSCIAFTSCELPLSTGKKYAAVHLLTGQLLYFATDVKGNGQELFNQVCDVLKITDTKWFGLALLVDDEYHFIDQNIKLSKYAPKAWKSLHGSGVDSSGKPLLSFHFRVQFYINCHLLINDRVARHHYYFQLRENVTTYSLTLSEERAFQLAAFALQADLGNYHSDKHKGRYFEPLKYFPAWIVGKIGEEYIIQHAPAMHKDITGISRGEAHTLYIKESSNAASPHNLHLYKLHRKKSKVMSLIWLGICFNGIEVYEENGCVTKKHLSTFLWSDIVKLCFEKKKFEIQTSGCPEPRKFTYYSHNEELAKNLLWLCRMTHQFNMFVQPQVQDLQRRELEEDKPYREAYIYSNSLDLAWEKGQRKLCSQRNTLPCGVSLLKKAGSKTSEQRVSVISNASSTTTSGIVSDKVQSFDESEDDLDMEIMINSPPANQSAEDVIKSSNVERHDHSNSLSSVPPDSGCSSFTGQSSTVERKPSLQTAFCKCAFLPKDCSSQSSYPSTSSSFVSDQEYHPSGICVKNSVININNSTNCAHSEQQTDKTNSVQLNIFNKEEFSSKNEISVGQFLANPSQDKLPAVKPFENGNSADSQPNKVTLHIEGKCKASIYSGSNNVKEMKNGHTSSLPSNSHSDTNYLNVPQNSISNQSVSFPHYHGRTATRIGVSSLTRFQRLPLTLFGRQSGIGVAGSEPNLSNVATSPTSLPCYFEGRLLSLPFGPISDKDVLCSKLGEQNGLENCARNGLKYENGVVHSNEKGNLLLTSSIPLNGVAQNLSSKNFHSSNNRNSSPNGNVSVMDKNSILFQSYDLQKQPSEDPLRVTGTLGCSSRMRLGSLPVLPTTSNSVNGDIGAANSLDLQQLRQKSQDMDLPLISALCNDRSLLMLPKTVPTCSRQRHLGTNKDMRRFSYTYMNSGSSDGLSSLGEIKDTAVITQSSVLSRPISWHVESAEYPWKLPNDYRGENKLQCSTLQNGNLNKDFVDNNCTDEVTSALSSTILTSFSKLSDRRTHNGSKDGYSGHIAACGANPKQMIPMKLSSVVMR